MQNIYNRTQLLTLRMLLRLSPRVQNNNFNNAKEYETKIHPKLDLVSFSVKPLLFTKSCSSLNRI